MILLSKESERPVGLELEIPTRPVTAVEIRERWTAHRRLVEMDIAPAGSRINLREGFTAKHYNLNGEAFIYWDEVLNGLNGTYMEPSQLLEFFDVAYQADTGKTTTDILLGDSRSEEPILTLKSRNGFLTVNFFGGSTQEGVRYLSENSLEDNSEDNRLHFQTVLYDLLGPILRRPDRTFCGRPSLIETEDCAATWSTLGGAQELFSRLCRQEGLELADVFSGRRVDLAVVTAQALVLASLEAKYHRFPIEINASFPGWGLTYGIAQTGEHRNYIAHPPFLAEKFPGLVLVVGDMGKRARRLPETSREAACMVPWEQERVDDWIGGTGNQQLSWTRNLEREGSLNVGYANGGLLVMAQRDALLNLEPGKRQPTIMSVAKRLDDPKGQVDRFDDIIGPFMSYLRYQLTVNKNFFYT